MPLYRNTKSGETVELIEDNLILAGPLTGSLHSGARLVVVMDRRGKKVAIPQSQFFDGDHVLTDNWGLDPREVEREAELIYSGYDHPPEHPWVAGGNSDMQQQARREARERLSS